MCHLSMSHFISDILSPLSLFLQIFCSMILLLLVFASFLQPNRRDVTIYRLLIPVAQSLDFFKTNIRRFSMSSILSPNEIW